MYWMQLKTSVTVFDKAIGIERLCSKRFFGIYGEEGTIVMKHPG